MKQIILHEDNFEHAKKAIQAAKGKEIIFSSNSDELNRKILEKEKIDILLIRTTDRKDKMKQRDSGFNQILAKLAKKKNVTIGINLSEIIYAKTEKEKSRTLARIRQNIKLCAKNKVKMKFITVKREGEEDPYNLKALGLILGMPTWMTKSV